MSCDRYHVEMMDNKTNTWKRTEIRFDEKDGCICSLSNSNLHADTLFYSACLGLMVALLYQGAFEHKEIFYIPSEIPEPYISRLEKML